MAGAGCRRAGRERAGRRAWPARPASWALGRRRRPGGTPGLPSRRPALGPAPGLCHCPCPGARGARAARPRGAPRRGVIRPGRGLAPCASGSRRRPQAGRARWASATERARWGRGASGRGRRRGDVSARPAPSDPALGAERRVPPPAERGGCAAAAATSFPPPPARLALPVPPLAVSRPGATGRGSAGALQVRAASGCYLPSRDVPFLWPRSRCVCRPRPCSRRGGAGKEAGNPSRAPRLPRAPGAAPGPAPVAGPLVLSCKRAPGTGSAPEVATHQRGGFRSL